MMHIRGVSCHYGPARAVDGVDCTLEAGEITVLLGASGSGKTTLLRAIAGFEPVSAGTIEMDGRTLSSPGSVIPPEHRQIGIVAQNFALFPHLTVWQNVCFGIGKGAGKGEDTGFAESLLESVNLGHRRDAYPHQLSGGEQQRIALVRALAPRPQAVLLDEAFSSLDRHLRRALGAETRRLLKQSGAAVLIVTHDADEALELGDNLLVMDRGQIIDRGDPENLYWQPGSATSAQLFGVINVLEGIANDGTLATPIGALPAPDIPDGRHASALIRPAAIELSGTGAGNATVEAVSRAGPVSRVVLRLSDQQTLVASLQGVSEWQVGQKLVVRLVEGRYAIRSKTG